MAAALSPLFPFHPDETYTSWAARMAAFHIRGPLTIFLKDLGLDPNVFATGYPDEVAYLCKLAGQNARPVLWNTVVCEPFGMRRLGRELIKMTLCPAEELRFCPTCLAEDDAAAALAGQDPAVHRRERLSWLLKPVRCCPVHFQPLVRRNRPQLLEGPGAFAEAVPEKTSELVEIGRGQEFRLPSLLQTYVCGRIEGSRGPSWLDEQTIDQAVRATEALGTVLEFGPHIHFEDLSDKDRDKASSAGYWYASKGVSEIRRALAIVRAQADLAHVTNSRRIHNTFGTLLDEVKEGGENTPLRQLLQDEIADMT